MKSHYLIVVFVSLATNAGIFAPEPANIDSAIKEINMAYCKKNPDGTFDQESSRAEFLLNANKLEQDNKLFAGQLHNVQLKAAVSYLDVKNVKPELFANKVSQFYKNTLKSGALSWSEVSLLTTAIQEIKQENLKGYAYLNSALEKIAQSHGGKKLFLYDIDEIVNDLNNNKPSFLQVGYASFHANIGHFVNKVLGTTSKEDHSGSSVIVPHSMHENLYTQNKNILENLSQTKDPNKDEFIKAVNAKVDLLEPSITAKELKNKEANEYDEYVKNLAYENKNQDINQKIQAYKNSHTDFVKFLQEYDRFCEEYNMLDFETQGDGLVVGFDNHKSEILDFNRYQTISEGLSKYPFVEKIRKENKIKPVLTQKRLTVIKALLYEYGDLNLDQKKLLYSGVYGELQQKEDLDVYKRKLERATM